jgi:hypothetical protein
VKKGMGPMVGTKKNKREVGRRKKKLKYGGMIFCKVFSIVIL